MQIGLPNHSRILNWAGPTKQLPRISLSLPPLWSLSLGSHRRTWGGGISWTTRYLYDISAAADCYSIAAITNSSGDTRATVCLDRSWSRSICSSSSSSSSSSGSINSSNSGIIMFIFRCGLRRCRWLLPSCTLRWWRHRHSHWRRRHSHWRRRHSHWRRRHSHWRRRHSHWRRRRRLFSNERNCREKSWRLARRRRSRGECWWCCFSWWWWWWWW